MSAGTFLRDPERAAAVGLVAAFAALVVSGAAVVSITLVAVSMALTAGCAWRGIRHPVGALAAGTVGVWVGYGALISSTPPVGDPAEIVRWAENDARFVWPFFLITAVAGFRDRARFEWAVWVSLWLVVVTTAVALVVGRWSDAVRVGDLLRGFTSSHHVMGGLTMSMLLVLVGLPRLVPYRAIRLLALAVLALALVDSGSRASFIGLIAGLLVIIVPRVDRRTAVRVLLVSVVLLVVAVATVPRLNTTARTVVSGEFVTRSVEAFRGDFEGPLVGPEDSEAAANMYIRFALWGRATDLVTASPFVGAGAFRFNDVDRGWWGTRGLVYVATSGENRFDDSQAHSTYFQVAAETGLLGLVLFGSPFVLVWRSSRRVRPGVAPPGPATAIDRVMLGVAGRALILAGAAAGLVSEGVFSPNTGVPVAILGVGGALVASSGGGGGGPGQPEDRRLSGKAAG